MEVSEIQKDIQELQKFESEATRSRVKDLLSLQIRKLQTEAIRRGEENTGLLQNPDGSTTKTTRAPTYIEPIKTYAWDQSDKFLKLYITLKDVDENEIGCQFTDQAVRMKIGGFGEKVYELNISKLAEKIDPDSSYYKVKKDTILVMLRKKETGKKWAWVTDTERKAKETKKPPSMDEKEDPSAGIMKLLQNMYEDGIRLICKSPAREDKPDAGGSVMGAKRKKRKVISEDTMETSSPKKPLAAGEDITEDETTLAAESCACHLSTAALSGEINTVVVKITKPAKCVDSTKNSVSVERGGEEDTFSNTEHDERNHFEEEAGKVDTPLQNVTVTQPSSHTRDSSSIERQGVHKTEDTESRTYFQREVSSQTAGEDSNPGTATFCEKKDGPDVALSSARTDKILSSVNSDAPDHNEKGLPHVSDDAGCGNKDIPVVPIQDEKQEVAVKPDRESDVAECGVFEMDVTESQLCSVLDDVDSLSAEEQSTCTNHTGEAEQEEDKSRSAVQTLLDNLTELKITSTRLVRQYGSNLSLAKSDTLMSHCPFSS
ncbi:hypothetical protein BaRGS_00017146 [Batillaria attramentaria]|uniref:CS domain-containing protein n=1 Tax=Batillaria attramentaria TaxID=370345 RepID=A0ABD0KWJ9_9CAEN